MNPLSTTHRWLVDIIAKITGTIWTQLGEFGKAYLPTPDAPTTTGEDLVETTEEEVKENGIADEGEVETTIEDHLLRRNENVQTLLTLGDHNHQKRQNLPVAQFPRTNRPRNLNCRPARKPKSLTRRKPKDELHAAKAVTAVVVVEAAQHHALEHVTEDVHANAPTQTTDHDDAEISAHALEENLKTADHLVDHHHVLATALAEDLRNNKDQTSQQPPPTPAYLPPTEISRKENSKLRPRLTKMNYQERLLNLQQPHLTLAPPPPPTEHLLKRVEANLLCLQPQTLETSHHSNHHQHRLQHGNHYRVTTTKNNSKTHIVLALTQKKSFVVLKDQHVPVWTTLNSFPATK